MGPKSIQSAYKLLIHQMWNVYRPQLFITLHWKDLPTSILGLGTIIGSLRMYFYATSMERRKQNGYPISLTDWV